jgi:hypothetical protein
MNKRIKELLDMSKNPNWDGEDGPANECNMEKFSGLIIDECLRMCEVAQWGHITHGDNREANGAISVQHYIEQHLKDD